MAVTLRLYQIEYDSGNDELNVIDEISDVDEKTVSLGEIEETVEREKGEYRIGNVSFTLRDVAKDKFADSGNFNKPWVLEIYDSPDGSQDENDLLFAGPVLAEDATYNADTKRTALQAASWLYLLKQGGEAPARYVYETEAVKVNVGGNDSLVQIFTPLPEEGPSVPQAGDVAVYEKDGDEYRTIVRSATDATLSNGDTVRLSTLSIDIDIRVVTDGASGDLDQDKQINLNGFRHVWRLKDADQAKKFVATFEPDDVTFEDGDVFFKKNIEGRQPFFRTFDTNGNITYEKRIDSFRYYVESEEVRFSFGTDNNNLKDVAGGYEILYPQSNIPVLDQGAEIEFLGKDMYGYSGNGDSITSGSFGYDAGELVSNIFTLNDPGVGGFKFGVLGPVFEANGTTSVTDGTLTDIDPEVRFPTKPLEALRTIQQTTESFLRITPRKATAPVSGDTVPSFDAELISRSSAFTSAVSQGSVSKWEEDVSGQDVRAVVIRPNEPYLEREDEPEPVGFFFDGIDDFESYSNGQPDYTFGGSATARNEAAEARRQRAVPEGDGVIEIEVAVTPTYEGFVYGGNEGEVINDVRYRKLAERFYERFTQANRKVRATVLQRANDLLGKYVTFSSADADVNNESVLITKQTYSVVGDNLQTSYEGRIGTFVAPSDTDPVAVARGIKEVRVASGSDATVSLTASRSYDTNEGKLSYSWEKKQLGQDDTAYASVNGGYTLNDTITGVTGDQTYVYRLTVSNSETGLTGQTEYQVLVGPTEDFGIEPPTSELSFEKIQLDVGGIETGRVFVQPRSEDVIKNVDFRAISGSEFPETGGPSFSAATLDTSTTPHRWYGDVDIDEKHVSNIEMRIEFADDYTFKTIIRPFTFDFNTEPNIRHSDLTLVEVEDDNPNTSLEVIVDEDSTGFEYRTATTGVVEPVTPPSSGDYSAWDTTYQNSGSLTADNVDNPLLTTPRFETLWVQVRAYDSNSGKYSTIRTFSIANTAFYSGAEGVWSDVGGGEIRYDAGGVQIGTDPITSGNGAGDLSVQVGVSIGAGSSGNNLILDTTGIRYEDNGGAVAPLKVEADYLYMVDNNGIEIRHGSNSPKIQLIDTADGDYFDLLMNRNQDFFTVRYNGVDQFKVGDGYVTVEEGGEVRLYGEDSKIRFIDNLGSDFEWIATENGADFAIQHASTIGGTPSDVVRIQNDGTFSLSSGNGGFVLTSGASDVEMNMGGDRVLVNQNDGDVYAGVIDATGGSLFLRADGSDVLTLLPNGDMTWGNLTFDGTQDIASSAGLALTPDNNAWIDFNQADSTGQRYFQVRRGSGKNIVAHFDNEGHVALHGTGGTHKLDVHAPTGGVISVGDVDQTNSNSLVYLRGGDSDAFVGTRHGDTFYMRVDNVNVARWRPFGLDLQDSNLIRFEDTSNANTPMHITSTNSETYDDTGIQIRTTTNPADGDSIFRVLSSGGAERLRVEHNGVTSVTNDFEATGEVTAFASSDRRKKNHLTPIENPLEMLRGIKGYEYQWNENERESKRGKWSYGIVAQEIQKYLPHAVRTNETDGYLAVEGRQLHGFHVAVNRSQQAEIERLKRRVKRLEAQL